jgi:hypothetical protein
MLAAQELGIPVVNAYTGTYPGYYMKFWVALDRHTLEGWCWENHISSSGIRFANNIDRPILRADTVWCRAVNDRYLTIDAGHVLADRPKAQLWETFVRLQLDTDHFAFVAHDDHFLSAELHRDSGLVAVSDRLGDMGVFRSEARPDKAVALIADNGRYLVLDTTDQRLYARGDSSNSSRWLRIEPFTP